MLPRQHRHGLSERRCRSYRQTNVHKDTFTMKKNHNEDLFCLMSLSMFSSVPLGAVPGSTAPQPHSHRPTPLRGHTGSPAPLPLLSSQFSCASPRAAAARAAGWAPPRSAGCNPETREANWLCSEPPPRALPAGAGPCPSCPGPKGGLGPGKAPRGGSRPRQALSHTEPHEPTAHSPLL